MKCIYCMSWYIERVYYTLDAIVLFNISASVFHHPYFGCRMQYSQSYGGMISPTTFESREKERKREGTCTHRNTPLLFAWRKLCWQHNGNIPFYHALIASHCRIYSLYLFILFWHSRITRDLLMPWNGNSILRLRVCWPLYVRHAPILSYQFSYAVFAIWRLVRLKHDISCGLN